jgi:hypothetical protein
MPFTGFPSPLLFTRFKFFLVKKEALNGNCGSLGFKTLGTDPRNVMDTNRNTDPSLKIKNCLQSEGYMRLISVASLSTYRDKQISE